MRYNTRIRTNSRNELGSILAMKKYMFNHRRGKKISHVNNKGFSYMELMVAMVIIGIVGAAFTGVVFTSGKASDSHKLDLEALAIAQFIIEDARAYRDDKINGGTDNPSDKLGVMRAWRANSSSSTITDEDGVLEYSYDYNSDGFSYSIVAVVSASQQIGDIKLVNIQVSVKHEASQNPVILETNIKAS